MAQFWCGIGRDSIAGAARDEVGIRLEVGEAPGRCGPLVGGSDECWLGVGSFSSERRMAALADSGACACWAGWRALAQAGEREGEGASRPVRESWLGEGKGLGRLGF